MLGIVVTAILIYLAIGAILWALWLHSLDRARDIPLTILTWPRAAWRGIARQSAMLGDIEEMRRHTR